MFTVIALLQHHMGQLAFPTEQIQNSRKSLHGTTELVFIERNFKIFSIWHLRDGFVLCHI